MMPWLPCLSITLCRYGPYVEGENPWAHHAVALHTAVRSALRDAHAKAAQLGAALAGWPLSAGLPGLQRPEHVELMKDGSVRPSPPATPRLPGAASAAAGATAACGPFDPASWAAQLANTGDVSRFQPPSIAPQWPSQQATRRIGDTGDELVPELYRGMAWHKRYACVSKQSACLGAAFVLQPGSHAGLGSDCSKAEGNHMHVSRRALSDAIQAHGHAYWTRTVTVAEAALPPGWRGGKQQAAATGVDTAAPPQLHLHVAEQVSSDEVMQLSASLLLLMTQCSESDVTVCALTTSQSMLCL
jgi:hypothetical protein